MAKLQVPIDDNLMKTAKLQALQEGITLKEFVVQALQNHINTTSTTSNTSTINTTSITSTTIENTTSNTESTTQPEPTPEDYYLLRKTHKTSPPLSTPKQYALGPFSWYVFDGSKAHFDKDGNPIPIRYTDETGKVQEPDQDELQELSEYLGKPIKIEK